jgi:hypothetical protein
MGIWTSAALKGLAILSAIPFFLFIVPVIAPFLVATAMIFLIVLFFIFTPFVLVFTAALAMFLTLPGYIIAAAVLALTVPYFLRSADSDKSKPLVADDQYAPVSVNYFPSRDCNYACGFCFHTNTSGYILSLDEAKRGLRLLKGKIHSPFAAPRLPCLEWFKHNTLGPVAGD